MIFCVEGGDGSGKSTVAEAVATAMRATLIHFPNDNVKTGGPIRSYLRKEWRAVRGRDETAADEAEGSAVGALAFQSLNIVNRLETLVPHMPQIIRGDPYVFARYFPSAWVYGQLDGLDPEWLVQVHRMIPPVNVYVLLDAPAEVCMERRAARDGALAPERYEGKLEFTRKVVDLYRQLWANPPEPFARSTWAVVDATQPLAEVIKATAQACVDRMLGRAPL